VHLAQRIYEKGEAGIPAPLLCKLRVNTLLRNVNVVMTKL
jgi:hypothetical protein